MNPSSEPSLRTDYDETNSHYRVDPEVRWKEEKYKERREKEKKRNLKAVKDSRLESLRSSWRMVKARKERLLEEAMEEESTRKLLQGIIFKEVA